MNLHPSRKRENIFNYAMNLKLLVSDFMKFVICADKLKIHEVPSKAQSFCLIYIDWRNIPANLLWSLSSPHPSKYAHISSYPILNFISNIEHISSSSSRHFISWSAFSFMNLSISSEIPLTLQLGESVMKLLIKHHKSKCSLDCKSVDAIISDFLFAAASWNKFSNPTAKQKPRQTVECGKL